MANSSPLAQLSCQPCNEVDRSLPENDIQQLLTEIPLWQLAEIDGIKQLSRAVKTNDFDESIALANNLTQLANDNNHHPALVVEWGRLTVRWWTHSISALHLNDFIMAAKTDALLASSK